MALAGRKEFLMPADANKVWVNGMKDIASRDSPVASSDNVACCRLRAEAIAYHSDWMK
jgi:hypothetical protein